MDKKIMLGLVFGILLVGSLVLVGAAMTITNSAIDIKSYDVEIQVVRGWNLIASGCTFASYLRCLDETGEIKKENIKAAYVYSNKINEYLASYPEYDQRLYSSSEYFKGDEQDIVGQANWIYVDKSGTLKYQTKAIKTIDSTNLFSGWNFISITPEISDGNIKSIKGNCNIEKAYVWYTNGGSPEWKDVLNVNVGLNSFVGRGIVMKVSSDCQLGGGASTIPPLPGDSVGLPSSGKNSCYDNGNDFYTKNTLTITRDGETWTDEDTCLSDGRIQEQICLVMDKENCDAGEYCWNSGAKYLECPNGCSDGKCIGENPSEFPQTLGDYYLHEENSESEYCSTEEGIEFCVEVLVGRYRERNQESEIHIKLHKTTKGMAYLRSLLKNSFSEKTFSVGISSVYRVGDNGVLWITEDENYSHIIAEAYDIDNRDSASSGYYGTPAEKISVLKEFLKLYPSTIQ